MMDSAKRLKLEKSGPVVFAERYDRFCTNCSNIIDNSALEKIPEKACSKCFQQIESRNNSDGNWRRCVRCDSFIRCTFKVCFLCARPNVHYDGEKPQRLEKVQQLKFEQLSKIDKVEDQQLVLYSSRVKQSGTPGNSDQPIISSMSASTPLIHERFDRFCTSCGSVIENAALEKFVGQKCIRCMHEIEFRVAGDELWNRCVKCDVFLRCTFKFCYLCGRRNFYYNAEGEIEVNKFKFQKFLNEKKINETTKGQDKKTTSDVKQSNPNQDDATAPQQTNVKVETELDQTSDDEELAAAASKAEDIGLGHEVGDGKDSNENVD